MEADNPEDRIFDGSRPDWYYPKDDVSRHKSLHLEHAASSLINLLVHEYDQLKAFHSVNMPDNLGELDNLIVYGDTVILVEVKIASASYMFGFRDDGVLVHRPESPSRSREAMELHPPGRFRQSNNLRGKMQYFSRKYPKYKVYGVYAMYAHREFVQGVSKGNRSVIPFSQLTEHLRGILDQADLSTMPPNKMTHGLEERAKVHHKMNNFAFEAIIEGRIPGVPLPLYEDKQEQYKQRLEYKERNNLVRANWFKTHPRPEPEVKDEPADTEAQPEPTDGQSPDFS